MDGRGRRIPQMVVGLGLNVRYIFDWKVNENYAGSNLQYIADHVARGLSHQVLDGTLARTRNAMKYLGLSPNCKLSFWEQIRTAYVKVAR